MRTFHLEPSDTAVGGDVCRHCPHMLHKCILHIFVFDALVCECEWYEEPVCRSLPMMPHAQSTLCQGYFSANDDSPSLENGSDALLVD